MLIDDDFQLTIQDVSKIVTHLTLDALFTMPLLKFAIEITLVPEIFLATDGTKLFVNPSNWNTLDYKSKLGLLYNEWLHIAFLHPFRLGQRDLRIWSSACNFANTNHIADDAGCLGIEITKGLPYDKTFHGMSSEEIYEILKADVEERKKNHNGTNNKTDSSREGMTKLLGAGEFSDQIMSDDVLPAPIEASKSELVEEIIRAIEIHEKLKGEGSVPGSYKEIVKETVKSTTPWEQIFHRNIKDLIEASNDRSFRKPKRWAWGYGIVLPSEIGVKKPDITLIIDTSGSIQSEKFREVLGEVGKILPLVSSLTMISADSAVHEIVKIRRVGELLGESAKFKFMGRKGTDFRPALEVAAQKRADLTIYYTDGKGKFGDKPRGLKHLLWLLTKESVIVPPFGKYLVIR